MHVDGLVFFFKQKTAYEMRISDWSSDVCSSDLVAVAAIGTVYAIDDPDAPSGQSSMIENLRKRWTLPTALAFLMWFVFAPQCISTIAITRRETNGWNWPAVMVGYLSVLAYIASGATYWIASAIGRFGRAHVCT